MEWEWENLEMVAFLFRVFLHAILQVDQPFANIFVLTHSLIGQIYEITLSGRNDMTGFLLYAQSIESGDDYRVGNWSDGPTGTGSPTYVDCQATVGQRNGFIPSKSISFNWTAPVEGVGNIRFKAIAVTGVVDWYRVNEVLSNGPGSPPSNPNQPSNSTLPNRNSNPKAVGF